MPVDRAAWDLLCEEAGRFPDEIRELPVARPVDPATLRAELARAWDFERPLPLAEAAAGLARTLREGTVHVTHPRYFGLFNPSVREASVVADALVALYNPQLAAWSHAPAANELERLTLARLGRLLGFDPAATWANFTSGGAEANLSAVLAALARRFPDAGEEGLRSLAATPTLYVSPEGHHSLTKIARMSGLGTNALREVPVTGRLTLDPAALDDRLAADARAGFAPLAVVATAGTTSAGVVDPLAEIADVAERHGVWLHVDAAWGGAAAFSPRLAPALAGIERADSVTWDAHKWLSVPMGAGMFFCRHPDAVRRAFTAAPTYMPANVGAPDPYDTTVQWSRRATGLKVFLALAELGVAGYRDLVEHQAEMGDRLRELFAGAGWRIVNDTPLPLVCFTHPALDAGRPTVSAVAAEVQRRGRVWISEVALTGRGRALRACITSYRSNESDLEVLVEEVETVRERLAGSVSQPE